MEKFPGNSINEKKTVAKEPVKSVVKGKASVKQKSFGKRVTESMLGSNSKNVVDYIIYDVIVPGAKDVIVSMVQNGIEMLIHGEVTGRRSGGIGRSKGVSYVSYNDYSKKSNSRPTTDYRKNNNSIEMVEFDRREDAEEVLSSLCDLIDTYEVATLSDLKDLIGGTRTPSDNKYGWTNLRDATITRGKGCYVLDLPRSRSV